jgi:hypothetical protein
LGPQNDGGFFIRAPKTVAASSFGPPKRWQILHLGHQNDGGFFIWATKTMAASSFGAMAAVVLRRRSALLRDRGALLRGGHGADATMSNF